MSGLSTSCDPRPIRSTRDAALSRVRRRKRPHRRRGATAIEYCFIVSLILMAILLAVQHFGTSLKSSFTHSESKMQEIGL